MSITRKPPTPREVEERPELFNHLNLPWSDDKPVENIFQPLQAWLLSGCLVPHFDRLYPSGDYLIGIDNGIYWKLTRPRLDGCKAPDWYFVPNVPRRLDGEMRRSYVLWQEHQHPMVVMEFVSGDGSEEHDETPNTGKFWIYERAIQAEYYVIWDFRRQRLEGYHRVNRRYQLMKANRVGRLTFAPLQVELGTWSGKYLGETALWLRAWDRHGTMLPLPEERAEAADQRAEAADQRAEAADQRAQKLAAKLRELGIAPDSLE